MKKLKKLGNRIFIEGLAVMAHGLFATLIIGTIIQQIGTLIGGNVGNILGKKLYKISKGNQVFCITHLAQIACFADSHYKVQKYEKDDKTFVDVNPLNIEDRYAELDRMIGGGSEYSRLHAIELITESNKFKN